MAGRRDSGSEAADAGALSLCACFNARSAARAITELYDGMLEGTGLRTTQFAILAAIHLREDITMQALATTLGLDPSTMTRTLRPLENEGLVRVDAGKDRRAKSLELTSLGRHKLGLCHRRWMAAQDELRGRLGSDVFERLVSDLGAVTEALRD